MNLDSLLNLLNWIKQNGWVAFCIGSFITSVIYAISYGIIGVFRQIAYAAKGQPQQIVVSCTHDHAACCDHKCCLHDDPADCD